MRVLIKDGKGCVDRYTILSKRTLIVLKEYYKRYRPQNWLFEGRHGLSHLASRTIEKHIENTVKRAGIKKNVTTHTLRHYVESDIMWSALGLCLFLPIFP
jgi:site-specific recombinase XerD